jgi:hypothetical protein
VALAMDLLRKSRSLPLAVLICYRVTALSYSLQTK